MSIELYGTNLKVLIKYPLCVFDRKWNSGESSSAKYKLLNGD